MDLAVRVRGGRTLAVRDTGDPAGAPALVQSGTPGSRHLYGPNVGGGRAGIPPPAVSGEGGMVK